MEEYKKRLATILAETGALFFEKNLLLKDGRPTPYFVNMAMFKTGRLALEMGTFFAEMIVSKDIAGEVDIILGPSYKGSSIALATAVALYKDHGIDLLFDYDRKEAKTHGEASAKKTIFVNQTLFDGCRIFVVDDVATSMGTKYELLEKIRDEGRSRGMVFYIKGIGICIDREQTTAVYDQAGKVVEGVKGDDAIGDFVERTGTPVYSVAGINEVVKYLYSERVPVKIEGKKMPIDEKTFSAFLRYVETYGVG
jgi:orotate phosphoribosyltransferase